MLLHFNSCCISVPEVGHRFVLQMKLLWCEEEEEV
jgi:hypothetical protein